MPVTSRRRHRHHVRAHLRPLAAILTNTLPSVAPRLLCASALPPPHLHPQTPTSPASSFHRGQLHGRRCPSRTRRGRRRLRWPRLARLGDRRWPDGHAPVLRPAPPPLAANAPPRLRLRLGLSLSGPASPLAPPPAPGAAGGCARSGAARPPPSGASSCWRSSSPPSLPLPSTLVDHTEVGEGGGDRAAARRASGGGCLPPTRARTNAARWRGGAVARWRGGAVARWRGGCAAGGRGGGGGGGRGEDTGFGWRWLAGSKSDGRA